LLAYGDRRASCERRHQKSKTAHSREAQAASSANNGSHIGLHARAYGIVDAGLGSNDNLSPVHYSYTTLERCLKLSRKDNLMGGGPFWQAA